MSERQSRGFIPPDVAEQCKVLGPNGKPCRLLQQGFLCEVKITLDRYGQRGDRIKDFAYQIPIGCPQTYDKIKS